MASPHDQLTPVKRALVELRDMRARLDAADAQRHEPIAVIGVGCRFPGGANDPESFWSLLRDGVDAIQTVPPDRWNLDDFYDADPSVPGKMATRSGGFIDGIDQFDHQFFGITPREAASLDPQQRLVLEVAWQALENAGQSPDGLMAQPVGIFIGAAAPDYFQLMLRRDDPTAIDAYMASGGALSVIAGRLAYFLGTQGPALVVDTACSSSLVAIHQACRSLRERESRLAIAGGVATILLPDLTVNFSQARMLAPDGRCKTFDAAADGYVRGEGCGIVVLKRLSDALTEGDRVMAVIRGSAVNQDGRSSGLTVPNGVAQEAVIGAALEDARLTPGDVDYVEAHGTGTSLGDPIEALAIARALGKERDAKDPVLVGSVKTNIGHLEAAAGVAGLIKVVLTLERGEIPPSLHFRTPNPHIDWASLPVRVVTEPTPWPQGDRPRRASVSSFGFSGTNSHIVLEAAPAHPASSAENCGDAHLLVVSARTRRALRSLAGRFVEYIERNPDTCISDICQTASVGRRHFDARLGVVASGSSELARCLTDWIERTAPDADDCDPRQEPRIAFAFSGQGSQYAGMGRHMYVASAVFREAIDRCDARLEGELDRRLPEILFGEQADVLLENPTYVQPGLFAFEYALAELWRSWGIRPSAVMGHSLGEYAAACVAGALDLDDALRLVAARGRLTSQLPRTGCMAAIFASEADVQNGLSTCATALDIAAINGTGNVVISGMTGDVQRACEYFASRGVEYRSLRISHAFHSAGIEPMLDEFERLAARISYKEPRIPLVSNVWGRPLAKGELPSADYWRQHTRRTVRFFDAITWAYGAGFTHFVEIGPRATLTALGRQMDGDGSKPWLPSMTGSGAEWREILSSLARLYTDGAKVDWRQVSNSAARRSVALPTYPFQRSRHWMADANVDSKAVGLTRDSGQRWMRISDAVGRQASAAPFDLQLSGFESKWAALASLSEATIASTLRRLGAFSSSSETFTVDSLIERCGIAESFRRLMERWLAQLVASGRLEQQSDVFSARDTFPLEPAPEIVREVEQRFADYPELLDYVKSCISRLEDVLRGAASPLDTLFPEGRTSLAEGLYERSAVARYFNDIVASIVSTAVALQPADRCLRVLELGAGTGGTTAAVLPSLDPDRTEYTFTDVGPLFLTRAEERFRKFPFIRYRTFDLEIDPEPQGFARGRYDMVIAANVLHATRDLSAVLRRAHELLAPGGVLVALEATEHPIWLDVTTGLIAGWQRFDDRWRGDHPLLAPDTWKQALDEAGFVRTASWPAHSSPAAILGQHVIAAQASDAKAAGSAEQSQALEPSVASETAPANGELEPLSLTLSRSASTDRLELLNEFVRNEIVRVLRLRPDQLPGRHQRLMDLGIDSLMAVELRNRLATGLALAKPLTATLVFDFPTIADIAGHLNGLIAPPQPAPSNGQPSRSVGQLADEIEDLDDDAVAALVDARLLDL
jgi:acyl transferase domain-containing protein/SAM-dependent methyltransferase